MEIVINEITYPNQAQAIQQLIDKGMLVVKDYAATNIPDLFLFNVECGGNLTLTDSTVIYYAKSLTDCRILTGDRQLNPQMKAQIYFVPNKVDVRMGTREELELWKQTDEEFGQSGIVAPSVGYRAQMKRVNTYNVPLPLKHAVYESFRFIVKSILR